MPYRLISVARSKLPLVADATSVIVNGEVPVVSTFSKVGAHWPTLIMTSVAINFPELSVTLKVKDCPCKLKESEDLHTVMSFASRTPVPRHRAAIRTKHSLCDIVRI